MTSDDIVSVRVRSRSARGSRTGAMLENILVPYGRVFGEAVNNGVGVYGLYELQDARAPRRNSGALVP